MLNRLTTVIFLLILFSNISLSKDFLILQSTTSTRDSVFTITYYLFFKEHNIEVRVIAVGTGQAIKNSENCDRYSYSSSSGVRGSTSEQRIWIVQKRVYVQ